MHHQHAGQLAGRVGGFGQITFDGSITIGRCKLNRLGLDAPVVFGHNLSSRKIGAERRQQHAGGHATHRKLLGPVQKTTAVNRTVHIGIKQNQQFLVKVGSGFAGHGYFLTWFGWG